MNLDNKRIYDALASWSGREKLQSALEERGYLVPNIYQSLVKQDCDAEFSELKNYWNEWALEFVLSAGRTDSSTRKFFSADVYKSDYLDGLSEIFNFSAALPIKRPHLLPCLFLHQQKIRCNLEFGAYIYSELKKQKTKEAALKVPVGFESRILTEESAISEQCARRGFKKRGGKFYKINDEGLIFCCGGNGAKDGGRLRLSFHLGHQSLPGVFFEISLFDNILPGMSYYYIYDDLREKFLGIKALIEFYFLFSESFDSNYDFSGKGSFLAGES